MKKARELLVKELSSIERYLDDASGDIHWERIKAEADDLNEELIETLLKNKELKKHFFKNLGMVEIFDARAFKFFIDENRIFNSYTRYKNRIGLGHSAGYLSDDRRVVLNFPFKDTFLEGGQSTDEQVRSEIFFNEVLAKDEIDRLLDPKALTNWKKYSASGNEKIVKGDSDTAFSDNLVIKGNNLLALHCLKQKYRETVKLVYIDPPYNTGGDANTFAYNNTFNHSTWLTFVKNRAEVAKEMITRDGFFAMSIDHAELFYAGVLLDEIFGRENRVGIIAIETNPRGRSDSAFFATSHEYLLIYAKNKDAASINSLKLTDEQTALFNKEDKISQYRLLAFRRSGSNSTPNERPNLFYPIYYNPKTKNISLEKISGGVKIEPIDTAGGKRVWRQSKEKCQKAIVSGDLIVKKNKDGNMSVYLKDRIKEGRKAKTFWSNPKYDASSHGTILLKDLLGKKLFSYPKSLHLMKDILEVLTNEGDLILDYHAGSGTTAHAVMELNKTGTKNRKFILVEQMDYVESVTCERLQAVLATEKSNEDFVFFELAKFNEKAKEKIQSAKTYTHLIKSYNEICDDYFLDYNLDVLELKKAIKETQFKALHIDEQKKLLLETLDLNQMYVNESEMADRMFDLSKEDQKLTKEFYSK